jgi:hypothetical protein
VSACAKWSCREIEMVCRRQNAQAYWWYVEISTD